MQNGTATTRSRSPRYPSHSIDQAVDYARKIYQGVHLSSVDSFTALQLMGFRGKSGASATALGSVRQFGLIEGIGDNTRITNLALCILEPSSEAERMESLLQAARTPSVFEQIYNRFDGRLPSANEPIRAYLIRDLNFSKSGADDCLTSLRSTNSYIDSFRSVTLDLNTSDVTMARSIGSDLLVLDKEQHNDQSTNSVRGYESDPNNDQEVILIPLNRDCKVELRFRGIVTEKAITNLIKHIELMKDVWAEG